MKTFNPTLAIPYLASETTFIPSPWLQDPSATDNTTVVADSSITPDGSNVNLKVQDGWRWIQLGNPTHVYTYARTEIALTNQIGFTVCPAGVITTIEWQGYFTSGLPAIVSGEPFVAPFQIHHLGSGSPPYGLEVDTSDHLLYLYIHNIDGTFNRRELIADFNDLVNVSTNIKANYKPNSAPGIADGSMQILLNDVEVFSESGVENCVVQNKDYVKFGIYDFTNAIVDPTDPGRGQSLEMVVENFSVYLAATPTRTHIDTSQAGVPVGGTTNQVLKKNSSTDFDYSWETGGGDLQTVTDAGNTTTNDIVTGAVYAGYGFSSDSGVYLYDGDNDVYGRTSAGDGSVFTFNYDGTYVFSITGQTGSSGIVLRDDTGIFTSLNFLSTTNRNITLPDASGTLALSVNGNTADSAGNITIAASPITIENSTSLFSTGLTGTGVGSGATYSNFLGKGAGNAASTVFDSNFFGQDAGNGATNAYQSNFFGPGAGQNASSSYQSNFLGFYAGINATNAHNSNFIGTTSGFSATNASYSNFIGNVNTGFAASNASYSTFIGYNVGKTFSGNNVGSNNIIIGTNISLANAAADSINIGGVLFGKNTYSSVVSIDPSIAATSTGSIGIGIVPASISARLHLPASTATAGTASLKIDPGVVATTPVSGNIESDGTHLYWTDSGGTRRQLDN